MVAHLRNTAASAWFDLNELKSSREGFEIARRIREEKLDSNDKEVAVSLANLGNLETAEEHFDEARDLLQRAAAIREKIGDPAATMLALTYLQIGRVDSLTKDYSAALKNLQKSEALFNRQTGSRDYLAEYVNFSLLPLAGVM
jgi:tetratricopeptide (TPR) repeat protein